MRRTHPHALLHAAHLTSTRASQLFRMGWMTRVHEYRGRQLYTLDAADHSPGYALGSENGPKHAAFVRIGSCSAQRLALRQPMILLEQASALGCDASSGCDSLRHRLAPRVSGQRVTCRLPVRVDERRQLLPPVKAHRPAAFSAHLLRCELRVRFTHARLEMRALLTLESCATCSCQTAARILLCFRHLSGSCALLLGCHPAKTSRFRAARISCRSGLRRRPKVRTRPRP